MTEGGRQVSDKPNKYVMMDASSRANWYRCEYAKACQERAEARAWARTWKAKAKEKRAYLHVSATVAAKYIMCTVVAQRWAGAWKRAAKKWRRAYAPPV